MWLATQTQLVNADWFLSIAGKRPLNGSGFPFQQTLVGEERVTKPAWEATFVIGQSNDFDSIGKRYLCYLSEPVK